MLISDICTYVRSNSIHEGFHEYIPLLHDLLTETGCERETKLAAIGAIGDTIAMVGRNFEPFIEKTLKVFTSAATMSVSDIEESDQEMMQYMISLHSALIDAFSSITLEIPNFSQQVQ